MICQKFDRRVVDGMSSSRWGKRPRRPGAGFAGRLHCAARELDRALGRKIRTGVCAERGFGCGPAEA